ncbi:MAG: hypothetical protein HY652_08650 [Acidobacteria bacterium]|nr:hypothetical protein [Acidobacteriota bacterium]
MSRLVGTQLPDPLWELLNGQHLGDHQNKAILVATVDPENWPHFAMLSFLEVIAISREELRLGPYVGSGTTANMKRTGKVTLGFVDEGFVYYVKGTARGLGPLAEFPGIEKVQVKITGILADFPVEEVEAPARIRTGIQVETREPQDLAQAQRMLAALKT